MNKIYRMNRIKTRKILEILLILSKNEMWRIT